MGKEGKKGKKGKKSKKGKRAKRAKAQTNIFPQYFHFFVYLSDSAFADSVC